MISNDTASFHGSTVVEFYCEGNNIFLRLEDVLVGERSSDVEIVVSACVSTLEGRASESGKSSLMAAPDGEVLTLRLTDRTLYLLVEWNDFESHSRWTELYDIAAEKVVSSEIEHKGESA